MGCICKGPNQRINDRNNQTYQVNHTQNKQINNGINYNNINKEQNNLDKNNNTNNNINKPAIPKYDPNLLVSTGSLMSNTSSMTQEEMIINGQKNSLYSYKPGDIDNNELKNYLQDKNKYANLIDVPLSESFSYFNNKNTNTIDIPNENKPGTLVSTNRPKLPIMQSQNIKNSQNNFNKGNKINISLGGSGTGDYIYYPNRDKTPLPDLENMSEKFLIEN